MMRAGTLDEEHDLSALAYVTFKYSHRKCILGLPHSRPLPVIHLHRVFERRPLRVACGDHEVDDIIRPQYLWRIPTTTSKPPWAKTSGKAACQSKALGCTAGSLMMLLPSRMVWSRLVRRLPRAAVLIQRLSWQIWMASALRSTP